MNIKLVAWVKALHLMREKRKEKELSIHHAFLAELSAWMQTPSDPALCVGKY